MPRTDMHNPSATQGHMAAAAGYGRGQDTGSYAGAQGYGQAAPTAGMAYAGTQGYNYETMPQAQGTAAAYHGGYADTTPTTG